jgi:inhibitor of KinA
MNYAIPYRVFPLGDSAITVDFGNLVDKIINQQVMAIFYQLQKDRLPGMIEAVPAYSTLTIYYDIFQLRKMVVADKTIYEWMKEHLQERLKQLMPEHDPSSRLVTIPVCYEKEFSPDIGYVASTKNISVEEVIHIHTSQNYHVYMLGFLPGFAYMGEVNEQIVIPRKQQPRQKVEAGSVGLAGKQTGIYPFASPGGWQIIGRTPVKLFDAAKDQPTLLSAGDRVQFISIGKDEFESY